jgi:hypothetical protein
MITGRCRSWLASEKPESAVGCQDSIVIVDDLREQARSYRFVSDRRSWLASEKPESAVGCQDSIVIVDDLREQARSYGPHANALRSDRRTQSQDNAPSFSAALPYGLSDTFACLAALA